MSQCTKPDALKVQVGGGHYNELKIQPVEFIMANGWDFCAGSVLKYVTRYANKNGRQDLEKAFHFVELRQELVNVRFNGKQAVQAYDYCKVNGLGPEETAVIIALDDVVWQNSSRSYLQLKVAIEHLIHVRYPPSRLGNHQPS